jgi:cytochrome c-type biogenesis protein CcmH
MGKADPPRRTARAVAGAVALAVTLAMAGPCLANEAAPASADPALEARVTRLAAELRCLVCQNQTIADSNAELAVDLRNRVREMLRAGRSDEEVLAYMTERYGDFVLYRPPLKPTTTLLWFGPALLLAIGAGVLVTVLRRRSRLAADRFDPDDDVAAADEPVPPPALPR